MKWQKGNEQTEVRVNYLFRNLFGLKNQESIDSKKFVYTCPKCKQALATMPNLCVPCQMGWRDREADKDKKNGTTAAQPKTSE